MSPLSLNLGGFGEPQDKVIPSESDVLAILSTASTVANIVTSKNLKQVQKAAHLQGTKKEREKERERGRKGDRKHTSTEKIHLSQEFGGPTLGKSIPPITQTAATVLISHGKTEKVSTSLLLPERSASSRTASQKSKKKKRKKPKVVISDDEEDTDQISSLTEDEHIDVVSTNTVNPFKHKTTAEYPDNTVDGSVASEIKSESTSLMLHLDKQYFHKQLQEQSARTQHTPAPSDSNPFGVTTYTAVQADPSSTKLVFRSQGLSRNSSPQNAGVGEQILGEGERDRNGGKKVKKKRKKAKRGIQEEA